MSAPTMTDAEGKTKTRAESFIDYNLYTRGESEDRNWKEIYKMNKREREREREKLEEKEKISLIMKESEREGGRGRKQERWLLRYQKCYDGKT